VVGQVDLNAILARGANTTETIALANRALFHIGAVMMGAGGHSATYNTAASRFDFPASAVGTTPAIFSSGELCRIRGQLATPTNGVVLSSSSACANN
jgi:hypothetical protein